MDTFTASDSRSQALARVMQKRKFFGYLVTWAAVSALVTVGWAVLDITDEFWPGWVIAAMGIGAVVEALRTFGPGSLSITDADIDRELAHR